jgi:hypothetical protein
MPLLPLAGQAYGRAGLPAARLLNMYVEQTPEGPTPNVRRPRPGLVLSSTIGLGPVRMIVTHQGYRYVVSGTRVYRDGVQIGILPAGLQPVRHAQSDEQLVVVVDGAAYLIDATVTQITMPDADVVSDVGFSNGRFIYVIADSGQYRYSEVGDAEDIGNLNFATAESDPDDTVSIEVLGSDVLFFGEKSTEWWGPTGSVAAPFQRYNGRRYDIGSAAQNSAVRMDNGIFWVGTAQRTDRTDLKVYRTSSVAEVISTPAIDALLSQCEDISTATAIEVPAEGRSFYVLNIPGVATVAFDVREKTWGEWSSYGLDNFRLQCFDAGLYGDSTSGKLWTFDTSVWMDGSDPIIRVCSAYLPASQKLRHSRLELYSARGEGEPGTSPVVEMRYTDSDDHGWCDWSSAALGSHGNSARIRWFQLGQIKPPGRVIEFRCSDDVLFAPYGVTVNE